MNAKIKRNFQVFSACGFIAAITQHIPDKRFQMVRYYGPEGEVGHEGTVFAGSCGSSLCSWATAGCSTALERHALARVQIGIPI